MSIAEVIPQEGFVLYVVSETAFYGDTLPFTLFPIGARIGTWLVFQGS